MTQIKQTLQKQITVANLPSHLTSDEQAGLSLFANRLYQQYELDLLRVVLFGSKVRGDFDSESDLDLLIVVRMTEGDYWQYWNEIVNIAGAIELDYNLVVSLIIKNEQDYLTMCADQPLLARNIQQDGVELWTMQPSEPIFKPI